MSSIEYAVAPRSVDVLPARVARRVTRRDGLLPLVLTVELLAGVAFGVAANSGQSAAISVPAPLPFTPVAQVTVMPSSAPMVGPAVGPLRPGTVRPPAVDTSVVAAPTPQRKHAPRNPFGPLARVK